MTIWMPALRRECPPRRTPGGRIDRGVDLFLVRYVGRHGDRILLAAEFGRRRFRGVELDRR